MEDQNPYRSPDAVVAEISDGELADRGSRLGAALIDGIIMLVLLLPLMYVGGYWTTAMEAATAGERVGFGATLMWALIGFAAFAVVQYVPLNASGQTWGKKFLKIRIVDMAGNKPPPPKDWIDSSKPKAGGTPDAGDATGPIGEPAPQT